MPAQYRVGKDVDCGVRAVYIDEVKGSASLREAEKSVVAGGFQEKEFIGVEAECDIGFEPALQRIERVVLRGKDGGGMRAMFHAAFKGVDYSKRGIGMVHEIIEDPGCGAAFESADLKDLQRLRAEMEG